MRPFLFGRNEMVNAAVLMTALTDAQIDMVAGAGTGCVGTNGLCCTADGCHRCSKNDCDAGQETDSFG